MQETEDILGAMGVNSDLLDSGCCGMAGSFGYERTHYDVSMKVGEHVLLPRIRSAPPDALIVADGFSCREQIAQSTDRRAIHLSEVLAMALPEQSRAPKRGRARWKLALAAAAIPIDAAWLIRRR